MSRSFGISVKVLAGVTLALAAAALSTGCKPSGQAGAGAGGGGGGFSVQVVVTNVHPQPVTEALSLVGSLAANEYVELKPETEGVVQEVLFQDGDRVQPAQLLIRLDESKLVAAVDEGEANFKLSKANLERSEQLFHEKYVSPQEYDQVKAQFEVNKASLELKRRQLKDARILAPFGGVLGARLISPGQVITKATTLTTLVDLDTVKVEVGIPERFLGQIKNGLALALRVAAFPGRAFTGEVYYVAAQLDPATRTALVKARISNPDHELRPGMFANLDLTLQVRPSAIVIPEPAVVFDGDVARIFVVGQGGLAQMQTIKLGIRVPGGVEVVEGLKPGDQVIVEGVQKLGPGVPVLIAGAAAPAAPAKPASPAKP